MPQAAKPTASSCNHNGSGKPTPKERGCFQCSRRRIVCDKGVPSCQKCIKKSIQCSGVNRIRFTEGVARRGRFKGCTVPADSTPGGQGISLPTVTTFSRVRWRDEKNRSKRISERNNDIGGSQGEFYALRNKKASQVSIVHPSVPDVPSLLAQDGPLSENEDVEEVVRDEYSVVPVQACVRGVRAIQPWIAPLSAEARMLFSHFSEAVAPVMVVLDTIPNGYRDIILPMALEDEVLRRAIGVVAAQHLGRQRPDVKSAAEAGRVAIISRLRTDSLGGSANEVFNHFTWATLIVLLVGETVTGSSDYTFLVQMLLSLAVHSAGNQASPVTRFLQSQTNLFELLGLPFLGEDRGVLAITKSLLSSTDGFSFISSEQVPADCEDRRTLDTIRECFSSACDIYMRRATSEPSANTPLTTSDCDTIQQSAIRNLSKRISLIPTDAPGAHALVWVCFVAGAEASNPDERKFFAAYMKDIHAKTKFQNIPAAIESLSRIWNYKGEKRWTQCLPDLSHVLVM